jgi:hypothetical protein
MWKRLRADIGARLPGLPVNKMIAITVATLWIAGAGWVQISGSTNDYGFTSRSYRKAIKACEGGYASRYECKSSTIISGENQAFIDWMLRLAIIFLPPLGLAIGYGYLRRRREEREAEEARRRIRARRRTA